MSKATAKPDKSVANTAKDKAVLQHETPSVTGDEKEKANIPDIPENPIANKLAVGVVSGVGEDQGVKSVEVETDPEAKQPDSADEINKTVVNPVAPTVQDNGVPEPTERKVASPDAQEEPTFHTGEDYNRLKMAFEKALQHGHMDIDYQRSLKKEAGIL